MGSYQQHALEGASAVDLVVALYDGMIRFLSSAAEAVDRGDVRERRLAVKRALDILIHLQARLRMDVGGRPAQALSEFYASIFAQALQASQSASRPKFEHAIACVRNVRDAWRQVARESEQPGGGDVRESWPAPRAAEAEHGVDLVGAGGWTA
ncbi:MAG TPA: flagellar export chaperone FliS [Terracidiphilus sp.]|nr:flagellar export chaperone FliS [Terracidiphilus sp.]